MPHHVLSAACPPLIYVLSVVGSLYYGDTQSVWGQPRAGDPQWQNSAKVGSLKPNEFVNPIGEGADPWVIRDPNAARYLWCMSEGNQAIAIHTSDNVSSMGRKHIVWEAPATGPVSKQIWAPELHYLDKRWHIYFAVSDGDNANHLTYVLRSRTNDPLGDYELQGPLATGDSEGFPLFGKPVSAGEVLTKPAGNTSLPAKFSLESHQYFGHHQYFSIDEDSIRLGKVPAEPINDYRAGEKVLFTGDTPNNLTLKVTIDFQGNAEGRDAGILFRTTAASIGYDAQRGYFAGLIPRSQLVILGRTDGSNWQELARAKTTIDANKPQRLTVQIVGDQITVSHHAEPKIQHVDATYKRGAVGLRVVDTDAIFQELNVSVQPEN